MSDLSFADERSNRFVAEFSEASPVAATYFGVPGYEDRLDDFSPEGIGARLGILRSAQHDLRSITPSGPDEALAVAIALEWLSVPIDEHEAGFEHARLNVIDSPLQGIRGVFDLMATETAGDRAVLAARMRAVPVAISGYQASLGYAAERGQVAALRQVEKCIQQARTYAGQKDQPGYFRTLAAGPSFGPVDQASAAAADASYAGLADFLAEHLAPVAPDRDAVGVERYALASRGFLGATVDLAETYEWGWQEFLAIEAELKQVAQQISPGQPPAAAAAALDADPRYLVVGLDALTGWMQDLTDRAVDELGTTQFEIPEPLRRLECRIAPPGGGVGAYYTGPNDDFSRPASMWWLVEPGRAGFHTWRETSTVYHEGVPGHHLQIATGVYRREYLNDFRRLFGFSAGHGEGWALYAERLMRELGYLQDRGDLLGMLLSQQFRAARVVVDIGMHLELEIPRGTGFHEGEKWTPALGIEFLNARTLLEPTEIADEVDRYLGWPGQAPAYKVGERVWLQARESARRRDPEAFDLSAFHTAALNLGGMGLSPLATALERL